MFNKSNILNESVVDVVLTLCVCWEKAKFQEYNTRQELFIV